MSPPPRTSIQALRERMFEFSMVTGAGGMGGDVHGIFLRKTGALGGIRKERSLE